MFAGPIDLTPKEVTSVIEFLTAMITPALLISATGSLVLSTSTRLGRVVDRVRELEKRLSEMIVAEDKSSIPLYEKRLDTVVYLLDKVTTRSRILQRAMEMFYYGLGIFILTSVTIAVVAIFKIVWWLPVAVGVIGILLIFYGSLLMVRETRMATLTINAEMDFTWSLAKTVAPKEIIKRYTKTIDENIERTAG